MLPRATFKVAEEKPQPPPLNNGPVYPSWHDKYAVSILVFTDFQHDGA